ncbi:MULTISPECIES: VOC family protein [unclassified Crossiella]|uniref:VOC family protein n=1 Tax=unclassified Crossiella TaxID=2620835 RepID=UPI001FFE593B|nr:MULTISPECIES: VOC family protein [unclassified Crossiella]MCK2239543.1 VOC family protein [Crossiella sp. S99.2]MCK2252238.1 VOC family protein [Crossiella sp. S99.1]
MTTPAPTVWPGLAYTDAPAAIRFLTTAFGFTETLVVPGEADGEVAHAELGWPEGGGVMLGTQRDSEVCWSAHGSVYVVTATPDEVLARATAAGAELVRDIADTDYGSRGFTVRDPEGHLWSFGSYPGA